MTHSIKKPYLTEQGNKKYWKHVANKLIRNREDIPNGSSYKRLYDSWNITDYRFYCPEELKATRK